MAKFITLTLAFPYSMQNAENKTFYLSAHAIEAVLHAKAGDDWPAHTVIYMKGSSGDDGYYRVQEPAFRIVQSLGGCISVKRD